MKVKKMRKIAINCNISEYISIYNILLMHIDKNHVKVFKTLFHNNQSLLFIKIRLIYKIKLKKHNNILLSRDMLQKNPPPE